MTTPTNHQLRKYLEQVGLLVEGTGAEKSRLLEEVEGHLQDAIDHRVSTGMSLTEATQAAIDEFGPPSEAATNDFNTPSAPHTDWTHWLPIAVPLLLTLYTAAWALYFGAQLPGNSTAGERAVFPMFLQATVVFGGISCAGWLWLRQHRRPGVKSPAWLATAASIAVILVY